ncbi:MAG: HEAT repeat domain-containing protein [Planctomycetota bacterium]
MSPTSKSIGTEAWSFRPVGGTEGGVYRVSHAKSAGEMAKTGSETLDDVFAMPQMTSHWARESASIVKGKLGPAWDAGLIEKARKGTAADQVRALTLMAQIGPKPSEELLRELAAAEDPSVRAFVAMLLGDYPTPATAEVLTRLLGDSDSRVQRRACEAFVRSGLTPPVDPLLSMFTRPDRWLRYAARTAIERVPAQQWRMRVLESKDPMVVLHGLLALQRLGTDVLPADVVLEKELALLKDWRSLNPEQLMDAIRMAQLTLASGASGPTATEIGSVVNEIFPSGTAALDMEAARILAFLQVPGAIDKILAHMEAEQDQARQIHYALVLFYIKDGWDITQKGRLLDWYEKTRGWEGGHSFVPFLENIVGGSVDRYDPKTRRELLERWAERPYATRMVFRRSNASLIEDYDGLIERILAGITERPELDKSGEMLEMTISALSTSSSPKAHELLRGLFETQPDRRDQIVRILANRPTEENFPFLIRSLSSDDPSTLQAVVKALLKIDKKPDQADILRMAIVAALRLDKKQRPAATALLEKWTDADPIAYYQGWFKEKYPQQPAPELVQAPAKSKYTYEQLFDYLEKDPRGKEGDVERGKQIFAKANCVKCHQFLKEGQGIGPDLTSVRRRFQRKEIIDSLVYPSKVVSDQYKSVTLVMTDGSVHTGLLAKQAGSDKMVLWQSNATKLELAATDVEEQAASPLSVMPEGLLDELSLAEIADLFAFLETSKLNGPATATASAAAPPAGGQ